jgi:hypothetical protein
LYARNVRGLSLNNVRLEVAAADLRPAVVFENVRDAAVQALSVEGDPKAEAVLRFNSVRDALLSASRVLTSAAAFLKVIGPDNERITIDGGDVSKATKPVVFTGGASPEAVRLRM